MVVTYLVYSKLGTGSCRAARYSPLSTRDDLVASLNLVFGPGSSRVNPEGNVEFEVDMAFHVADYVGLTSLLHEAVWNPRTKEGLGKFIESLIGFSMKGISP